jgi:peptidoglycan/LPS O-acetylase OafA/YrhL
MKRSYLLFLVAGLVTVSVAYWLFSLSEPKGTTDSIHFFVIGLLVVFALFIGYKRLVSEKRGEPTEDELSKQILRKAAALSYFISLYVWVILLFLKDRLTMDTEQLIGTGILGMGVVFALSWLIINFRGIRHE